MSTVAAKSRVPSPSVTPVNDYVLLRDVSWERYCELRDSAENRHVRMYYCCGDLLLMTTGALHERIRQLLTLMLAAWCEETNVNLMCFGQWTLQAPATLKGLESDNCYYVSSLSQVEGKDDLNLEVDPPPDFAIEVDVTTNSELKFDIYAAMGIREIWIWDGGRIGVFRLVGERYVLREASSELEGFPLELAAKTVLDHLRSSDTKAIREFKEALSK